MLKLITGDMKMLEKLTTEQRNPETMDLDELSTLEIIKKMNEEDNKVIAAVNKELPAIAKIIDEVTLCLKKGGRLIYMGAGTSGRIGLLDAVECPPTFGMDPSRVIGILAGNNKDHAKEEAEDDPELAKNDLQKINLSANDIVIGLAASGRTPYVIGGLDYANMMGAQTAAIACNKNAAISKHAKLFVEVDNGPEVLSGSTRLKAGTAQKMICNMISTASMVNLGKVYENLMVDVDVSNKKLYHRWIGIVMSATGCDRAAAEAMYELSEHSAKAAICMLKLNCPLNKAKELLEENEGSIKKALGSLEK